MGPRLILIEGMIGSGKTTTATRVGDWFARQGQDVLVFAEAAADHPIRTRAEDRLRSAPGPPPPAPGHPGHPGQYPADQWRRLAERARGGGPVIIVEGSFLQNSVMPAFIEGAPAGQVDETVTRIVQEFAAARPFLVYLRPADIAAAITRIHRTRGEPWSSRNVAFVEGSPWARRRGLRGQDAVIELYRAWEPVVTRLYRRYPFPKLMLTDPQRDWPAALARICAAVAPGPRGPAAAQRPVGSTGGRGRDQVTGWRSGPAARATR